MCVLLHRDGSCRCDLLSDPVPVYRQPVLALTMERQVPAGVATILEWNEVAGRTGLDETGFHPHFSRSRGKCLFFVFLTFPETDKLRNAFQLSLKQADRSEPTVGIVLLQACIAHWTTALLYEEITQTSRADDLMTLSCLRANMQMKRTTWGCRPSYD